MNSQYVYLRKETENELQHKQAHRHQAQPRVQRIEIWNWWLGQIVRVENGQKTNDHTRNTAGMEQGVGQFDIDVLHATTQAVEQNRYKKTYLTLS